MTDNKDDNGKLSVINIGLDVFYDALTAQGAKAVNIAWRPPFEQSDEIKLLLDDLL